MNRVPGNPDGKFQLLAKLGYKDFPYLVADILYFLNAHQDVKILDGPGDGKRDILSVLPNGTKHITQCKHHQDMHTAVSSDETDQLVLALHKFGCKTGLFATSGRISPQAKREYLDNYPDFKLTFLEGTEIVDAVLSSPLLSSIWFDGESVTELDPIPVPFRTLARPV